jgi:hypothetical protein
MGLQGHRGSCCLLFCFEMLVCAGVNATTLDASAHFLDEQADKHHRTDYGDQLD